MSTRAAFLVLATLFGASIASAQSYYPYTYSSLYPTSSYGELRGACVNIPRDLSYGSRGSDVLSLQQFLVSQNYPGTGSWMLTSYFGRATEAAVKQYQSLRGLPVTGVADAATRAAIASCGYTNYNYPFYGYASQYTYFTYPYYNYTYSAYPYQGYSSPCGFGVYNCSAPTIQYLSPQSGGIGTTVTIYGSGFSMTGNTVRFGNGIITNLNSPDGRSLSFTVPAQLVGFGSQPVVIGTYPVSVINSLGVASNVVSFTVTSSSMQPTISSVSGPNTIAVGAQGTWAITVSAPAGTYLTTSVNWGDQSSYAQSASQNIYVTGSQTLVFTHTYVSAGTYTITFTVSSSSGSNAATATVNVTGGALSGQPSLLFINPSVGPVGAVVTITGSGFTMGGNTVHFGVGGKRDVISNGTVIAFTIPAYVSPCDLIAPGYMCGAPVTQVTSGTYPVYVTNSNGASNILYFTVQ